MGFTIFIYFLIWAIFLFLIIAREDIPQKVKWIHLFLFIVLILYWFPDILKEFQEKRLQNPNQILENVLETIQISFLSLLVLLPIISILISKVRSKKTIEFITYFVAIFFIIVVCLYIFVEMRDLVEIQIKD